jgi:hypothetical protein
VGLISSPLLRVSENVRFWPKAVDVFAFADRPPANLFAASRFSAGLKRVMAIKPEQSVRAISVCLCTRH